MGVMVFSVSAQACRQLPFSTSMFFLVNLAQNHRELYMLSADLLTSTIARSTLIKAVVKGRMHKTQPSDLFDLSGLTQPTFWLLRHPKK